MRKLLTLLFLLCFALPASAQQSISGKIVRTGTLPVDRINATGSPSSGNVLAGNGAWTAPGGDTSGGIGALTVTAIQGKTVPAGTPTVQYFVYDPHTGQYQFTNLQGPIYASVVATSNVTNSGTPTIDGVSTSAGSIVLETAETAAKDNGFWKVGTPWVRLAPVYDTGNTFTYGLLAIVGNGSTKAYTVWMETASTGVIDTDPSAWTQITSGSTASGTVTSVALTVPAWESVGGSPITGAGTFSVTGATGQASHKFVGTSTGTTVALNSIDGTDLPATGVKIDVSSGDTTADYLANKLVAGTNVTITKNNAGANETLTIADTGGGSIPNDYISGCVLRYNSTTTIDISTGTVGLANGSSYTVASTITITPSIAASTIYYVYLLTSSSATATTTAPTTNYAGTAWHDGTTSHRYVGAFLTDGSSHIIKFYRNANQVIYETNTHGSPFQVLSSGSATTATSVSCSGIVPATSRMIWATLHPSGSPGVNGQNAAFGTSDFAPTSSSGNPVIAWPPSGATIYDETVNLTLNSSQAFQYILSQTSSTVLTVYVHGYWEDR